MLEQEPFDDLVLEIHRCSLEPANWSRTLRKLASRVGAPKMHIFSPERGHVPAPRERHPTSPAIKERGYYCSGEVIVDPQLYDWRKYIRSDYFGELCDFALDDAAAVIVVDDHSPQIAPASAVALFHEHDPQPANQPSSRAHQYLFPHLRLAVENFWRFQRVLEVERAREVALDALATAVFAIDSNGHVLFANTQAEAELASGAWVALEGGMLKATPNVREQQGLEGHLQQLARGRGFAMQLHCLKTRASVTVCGAFQNAGHASYWSGPVGIVWIINTDVDVFPMKLATELFKLSPAEAKLLRHLGCGLQLKEAARLLGVKECTARAQLKSIFTKTGRHRQSELIALLERLALLRSD